MRCPVCGGPLSCECGWPDELEDDEEETTEDATATIQPGDDSEPVRL